MNIRFEFVTTETAPVTPGAHALRQMAANAVARHRQEKLSAVLIIERLRNNTQLLRHVIEGDDAIPRETAELLLNLGVIYQGYCDDLLLEVKR